MPDNKLADVNTNWRQRELVVRPIFDEDRARISGVTREELSVALQFSTEGIRVGSYRDVDESIPIVARKAEQNGISVNESVSDSLVLSSNERRYVPIEQVVREFVMEPQDTLIHRRDRVRTLTVKAETTAGEPRLLLLQGSVRKSRPSSCRRAMRWSGAVNMKAPMMRRNLWVRSCRSVSWSC